MTIDMVAQMSNVTPGPLVVLVQIDKFIMYFQNRIFHS